MLTNNAGMPPAFHRLVEMQNRRYESRNTQGEINLSVTTLSDPAYQYKLRQLHRGETDEEVVDYFLSFRGQMMHKALEDAGLENSFQEPLLKMKFGGVILRGSPDNILPGELEDYKMKTVEAYFNHSNKDVEMLERQLNPYRFMLWGIFRLPIDKLTAHIFLMNWVKRRAKFEHNYPPKPHFAVDVPVWTLSKTAEYLLERIALFLKPIEETEICSPSERWAQKTEFAVMKKGRKKAVRCLPTREEAEKYIEEKGGDSIVERPGNDNRCTGYCSVSVFCPYYKETYGKEGIEPPEEPL